MAESMDTVVSWIFSGLFALGGLFVVGFVALVIFVAFFRKP